MRVRCLNDRDRKYNMNYGGVRSRVRVFAGNSAEVGLELPAGKTRLDWWLPWPDL